MAGLRMVWIDDTGATPVPGGLAKSAYKRLGKWAFNKTGRWRTFIDTPSTRRLDYIATQLTASFNGTGKPNDAPNINPRIIILHNDSPPAPLTAGNVSAYHLSHEITLHEDGESYTQFLFKGDPKTTDFESYMREHANDVGEGGTIKIGRARRMFAMMLMTRCR